MKRCQFEWCNCLAFILAQKMGIDIKDAAAMKVFLDKYYGNGL